MIVKIYYFVLVLFFATISGCAPEIKEAKKVAVTEAEQSYTISVKLSGLQSNNFIVLRNQFDEVVVLDDNKSFVFKSEYKLGDSYKILVVAESNGQNCLFSESLTGIIKENKTIDVTCNNNLYYIGGVSSGLIAGTPVSILNSGSSETLEISTNSFFLFQTPLASKISYNISISSNPTGQSCAVSNAAGIVEGSNIEDIDIVCSDQSYTLSGTLSSTTSGNSLSLVESNYGETLSLITGTPDFIFTTPLPRGSLYNIAVKSDPASETCSITNFSGTLSGSDITNILVNCAGGFSIGNNISNFTVEGSQIALQVDSEDSFYVSATPISTMNYTSPRNYADTTSHSIRVVANPAGYKCLFDSTGTNEQSLTIASSNFENADISCTPSGYNLGGFASNLLGSTTFAENQSTPQTVTLSADGSYLFQTPISYGSSYRILVTPFPGQVCTPEANAPVIGTMPPSSITDINYNCSSVTYSIGGTAAGLSGTLSLLNYQNSDTIAITQNGNYSFSKALSYGELYSVSIQNEPAGQSCQLNGNFIDPISGTIAGDVTIDPTCSTGYSLGGNVASFNGNLQIKNTLSSGEIETLTVENPGAYTFNKLLVSGESYLVTPIAPNGYNCSVESAVTPVGTISSSNVNNIDISCTPVSYTLSGEVYNLIGITGGGESLGLYNTADSDANALATVDTGSSAGTGGGKAFTFTEAIDFNSTVNVLVTPVPYPGVSCETDKTEYTILGNGIPKVSVTCGYSDHLVGVQVAATSALKGSLILQNNGSDTLTINAGNNDIVGTPNYFSTPVPYFSPYSISIITDGSNGQFCELFNLGGATVYPTGTVHANNLNSSTNNVDEIGVNCYLQVASYYPTATYWNDYINTNTGSLCTGSEANLNDCDHAGPKRLVRTGYTSCSNLSMIATPDAFNWYCEEKNGYAQFYSELKYDKGLSDLVNNFNTSTWETGQVVLRDNGTPVQYGQATTIDNWGLNDSLKPINNNTGVLTYGTALANNIYGVDSGSDATVGGININGDRISVVAKGRLMYAGAGGASVPNCRSSSGENNTGSDDLKCLISTGGQKNIWVEGQIEGFTNANRTIYAYNTSWSKFWNLFLTEGTTSGGVLPGSTGSGSGLYLENSYYNKINYFRSIYFTEALHLYNSNYNFMENLLQSLSTSKGIFLENSSNNRLKNIRSYNNDSDGIYLLYAYNNVFMNLFLTSNNSSAFTAETSGFNKIFLATIINNAFNYAVGFRSSSDANILHNALIINNGEKGLLIENSDENILSQMVIARNGTPTNDGYKNIELSGSGNSEFLGTLIVDSPTAFPSSCVLSGTEVNPGIDQYCNPSNRSAVTLQNIIQPTATYGISQTFTGISANTSSATPSLQSSGVTDYSNIVGEDWTTFDNFFRTFAESTPDLDFPDNELVGPCKSTEFCGVWDWSLNNNDPNLFYFNKSRYGVKNNDNFISGASCPSQVEGDDYIFNFNSTSYLMLTAVEIIDDSIGDNDGLCETGEACLYTPHFGAYQGLGDLDSCQFNSNGGEVQNIIMYAYPTP